MKLTAINSLNYYKQTKFKKAKSATKNYTVTNSITNNSLQEAIGRSQITFNGKASLEHPGFRYEQANVLGKLQDEIIYDEKSGELTYCVHSPNGEINQQMRFCPEKCAKIITTIDEDGNKTEEKINPQGRRIEVKNSDNEQIYYRLEDTNGNKDIIKTERERGRIVKRYVRNGQKMQTVVIDLSTGKRVTKGPLVEDRFEGKDGIIRTINIVTGDLYRSEQYSNRNRDYVIIDYSKETGVKTRETTMERGVKTITTYNADGIRDKEVIIDKKGSKIFTTFGKDGYQALSTVQNDYDLDGKIKRRTIFEPGSDVISTIIEIDRENGTKTYYNYLIDPNIAISSSKYQGELLLEECEFYNTGKDNRILARKMSYDREESVEEFFKNGGKKPKTKAIYRNNGKPYKIELFSPTTGNVYERREVHPNKKGYYTISQLDEYSEKLLSKDVINSQKTLVQRIYFHPNGMQPKIIQDFHPDRSYTERVLDTKGKLISKKEFRADDIEKP